MYYKVTDTGTTHSAKDTPAEAQLSLAGRDGGSGGLVGVVVPGWAPPEDGCQANRQPE